MRVLDTRFALLEHTASNTMNINFSHLLIAILISLSPVSGQDTVSFGTGEVDPSVLRAGDRVEVSFRSVDPRSRSRFDEIVGTVIQVDPDVFVVADDERDVAIPYDAVIRMDRTRSDAWALDVSDLSLTPGELIEKYLESREIDGLEGTWVWDDRSWETVIVKTGVDRLSRYDYVGLVLAAKSGRWQSGEIKLLLKETAEADVYSAVFVLDDKTQHGTAVSIPEGRRIEAVLPTPNSRRLRRTNILKTYPIPEPADSTPATVEPLVVHGTGFFVTPEVVATANHLVGDADTIRVHFQGQSASAAVRTRDKRNDIALLAVDAAAFANKTIIPLNVGESSEVFEGDRLVATGFVSPDAPRVSIETCTVNSLFGPDEDLTRFTLSASLGRVAVGGPLIDASNRVVAVGLVSDTTDAGTKHSALKAGLLNDLLRLSSLKQPSPTTSDPTDLDPSLIGQMARSAVVLIEARQTPVSDGK